MPQATTNITIIHAAFFRLAPSNKGCFASRIWSTEWIPCCFFRDVACFDRLSLALTASKGPQTAPVRCIRHMKVPSRPQSRSVARLSHAPACLAFF